MAKKDLVVTNQMSNTFSVLIGNGIGSFSLLGNIATGINPISITSSDFNHDGKIDLALANMSSNNISIYIGTGLGTFLPRVNYSVGTDPHSITTGDFNGDGETDLAISNWHSNNVSVLVGSVTGTFAAAVNYSVATEPVSVISNDFNTDGKTDLAIVNLLSDNVSILLNCNTVGLNEYHSIFENMSVFPNPTNGDHINLNIHSKVNETITVTIIDNLGKVVFGSQKSVKTGGNQIELNLEYLANGFYYLNVVNDEKVRNIKFVKN